MTTYLMQSVFEMFADGGLADAIERIRRWAGGFTEGQLAAQKLEIAEEQLAREKAEVPC